MKRVIFIAAAMAHVLLAAGANADPDRSSRQVEPSPFMRIYGPTPPPFGFVHFCERMPSECVATTANETRFNATPQRLSELDEVNRRVNAAIQPATDLELYGTAEYWTLPTDRGDCEDYALLKRQILMKRGWPSGSLLLTVVRDENGEGHAVLTARTAQGDFILDNKVKDIRIWHKSGYRFVMRQSFVEPRTWMSLVPDAGSRGQALTSSQPRR